MTLAFSFRAQTALLKVNKPLSRYFIKSGNPGVDLSSKFSCLLSTCLAFTKDQKIWLRYPWVFFLGNTLFFLFFTMAANPIGSFFSYLHDAFLQNSANNKIVIDRRTIEKTWKYMDKVNTFVRLGQVFESCYLPGVLWWLRRFRLSSCAKIPKWTSGILRRSFSIFCQTPTTTSGLSTANMRKNFKS